GGKPYLLIGLVLVLTVGFATFPAITGCLLAYGYVALPLLTQLVRPVTRWLPTHAE
ncbi:MAG: CDP-diacylglycerol O-phosphatidyltransferase, partial [Geodermatophilaceae bacterium]|nr:CDP-diacylglycerol O-phosphatidyltransferase [Geodermatophilaceae bacterium]